MVQEGELALTSPGSVLTSDSIQADSLSLIAEPVYGIILTPPEPPPAATYRETENNQVSFILCGMFILFLIIALRFRNNVKYAVTMFRNLIETRTRQNIFDDTVRETSLIVLLNILWCVCAGIIGYSVMELSFSHHSHPETWVIGMLWGMVMALAYSLFMWGCYASVGRIFGDNNQAVLWVKGFWASQALTTPAFFLMALLAISRPDFAFGAGMVAAFVFIIAKLVFIWKGFRIFFNQFSSWVLFLCYLCSLEIVPLILCYRVAVFLA